MLPCFRGCARRGLTCGDLLLFCALPFAEALAPDSCLEKVLDLRADLAATTGSTENGWNYSSQLDADVVGAAVRAPRLPTRNSLSSTVAELRRMKSERPLLGPLCATVRGVARAPCGGSARHLRSNVWHVAQFIYGKD